MVSPQLVETSLPTSEDQVRIQLRQFSSNIYERLPVEKMKKRPESPNFKHPKATLLAHLEIQSTTYSQQSSPILSILLKAKSLEINHSTGFELPTSMYQCIKVYLLTIVQQFCKAGSASASASEQTSFRFLDFGEI